MNDFFRVFGEFFASLFYTPSPEHQTLVKGLRQPPRYRPWSDSGRPWFRRS